jgi:hypothetical protein
MGNASDRGGRRLRMLGLAALALLLATAASAAPLLPAAERFVYDRTVGDKRDQVDIRSRLVSIKGESYYELETRAPEQDTLIRLDPGTLFASYIEVLSRGKDATLRRVTTVLENKSSPGPDELVVSSFESLTFSLRAFPWGTRQKTRISFLGAGAGGNFRFDLSVVGKETMAVAGRDVACWKAQLSLGGVVGAFFGKSTLWYSVEHPHYLVKSEGAGGPPGTPTSVLVLASYSAGD